VGVAIDVGTGAGVGVGTSVVGTEAPVVVGVGTVAEGSVDDVVAAANAATQPRESTGVIQRKLAAWVPPMALRTSSLTMVPVLPLTWARSVAGAPAMAPAEAVVPLSAFMAPANTSDPAGTDAVDEVVSVDFLPELAQTVATGGASATPEYSAMDARIGPLSDEVTVTFVIPASALLRYQTDSMPSESASDHSPLRSSPTLGLDWVRTMATRRSELETGRGRIADSTVADPSAATP